MTTVTFSSETPLSSLTEERVAWLALALTPQLGPRRILRAVERCGSAAKIMDRGLTDLEALQFPVESVRCIADGHARAAADQQLDALAKTGGQFLTYTDHSYPERLREIFDPPAVLWLRGIRSYSRRHQSQWSARAIQLLTERAWPRCFHATSPIADSSL